MIQTLGTLAREAGHDLLAAPERRFRDVPSEKYIGMGLMDTPSDSGITVNESTALKYTVLFACVRYISEDIATLPLDVYEDAGEEKNAARAHYLQPILKHQPNREMTGVSFWETVIAHLLTWGNAYINIEWNEAGRVKALWPLLPDRMAVSRSKATGELEYRYEGKPIPRMDVLHIPGLGYDGILGYSPIAMARDAIGLGMAPEKFASKFYQNGAQLGTVFSTDIPFNQKNAEDVERAINAKRAGVSNAHSTMVLFGGLKPISIGIPPRDAQFIESRTFQAQEMCRLYRMPPHMVAEMSHATFTNIEHQDISYGKRTLRPWTKRIESALKVSLFGVNSRFYAEFNLDAMMRGDASSRADYYQKRIVAGTMTPNEVRRKENENPLPGGDRLYIQGAMVPLEMAGQQLQQQEPAE